MPTRPRLGGAGRTARYLQHWERVLMGSGGLWEWSVGASRSHVLAKPSNLVLKPQLNDGFCLVVWVLSLLGENINLHKAEQQRTLRRGLGACRRWVVQAVPRGGYGDL